MKRGGAIAFAVLLAASVAAKERPAPPAKRTPPPPRGIATVATEGGRRADARLAGRLIAWTLVRDAEGRREILVVLGAPPPLPDEGTTVPATCATVESDAPAAAPLRLARVVPRGAGSIEMLRDDIPGDVAAAGAFDVDGDRRDELVLFRPGRIETIAPGTEGRFDGARVAIVEDAEVPAGAPAPALGPANDPEGPRLRLAVVGALRTWIPDPARGRWRVLSDAPTPFAAERGADALRLVGPRVLPCGRDASGRLLFVTEAEAVGGERLRTRLLDPSAPPESRSSTCWARLPGPERVIEQSCLTIDGAPHLAVTTTSSEKLGLLGEKAVRLFPVTPDRTHTGAAPRFAAVSGMNLWQPTAPVLADADGDGRPDLVLPYWKGLKDAVAVVEVYRGRSEGGFETTARRTELEVDEGEKSWIRWGDDASGDGRPDLILFAGKRVAVHPGLASKDGRRVVDSKPALVLPWPEDAPELGEVWSGVNSGRGVTAWVQYGTLGRPAVSDLDGDGGVDLILAGDDAHGGRVIVFSFGPAPPRARE